MSGVPDAQLLTVSLDVSVIDATSSLEVRVSADNDDAEERPSGSTSLGSSDLELTTDKSNVQLVGMRFNGIDIPQGSAITNPYIQFEVDETSSGSTSLVIQGQAADNAPSFSSSQNNISTRPLTSASVAWSPSPWPTRNAARPDPQTLNLSDAIQQIVDRSGWSNGDSLEPVISGTGKRTAESYDSEPQAAPQLHIEFAASPSAASPQAAASALSSFLAPDAVPLFTSAVAGPNHKVSAAQLASIDQFAAEQ